MLDKETMQFSLSFTIMPVRFHLIISDIDEDDKSLGKPLNITVKLSEIFS